MKIRLPEAFLSLMFFTISTTKPAAAQIGPAQADIHPWQKVESWKDPKIAPDILQALQTAAIREGSVTRSPEGSTDVYFMTLENGEPEGLKVVFKTACGLPERAANDIAVYHLSQRSNYFPPIAPAVYREIPLGNFVQLPPYLQTSADGNNGLLRGAVKLFVESEDLNKEKVLEKTLAELAETDPKMLARIKYWFYVTDLLLAGGDNVYLNRQGQLVPGDFGNIKSIGDHSKEHSGDFGKPRWFAMAHGQSDRLSKAYDRGDFPDDTPNASITFTTGEGKRELIDQMRVVFGDQLSDEFYTKNAEELRGRTEITVCPYRGYLYRQGLLFKDPELTRKYDQQYLIPFTDFEDRDTIAALAGLTKYDVQEAFADRYGVGSPEGRSFGYLGEDYAQKAVERARAIVAYFARKNSKTAAVQAREVAKIAAAESREVAQQAAQESRETARQELHEAQQAAAIAPK